MMEKKRKKVEEKEKKRVRGVWGNDEKVEGWNRTAGFQGCSVWTESTKRSLKSPRLGCGFSVRFSLFFPLHHSRSHDRSSPSLPHSASFFLATWVWSPFTCSLTCSFPSWLTFSLILSSGPTLRRLWAPRAPERRSSCRQERGGAQT